MIRLITGLALSLAFFSGSVFAGPISTPLLLDGDHIVGIIDTTSGGSGLGNEANEMVAAQALLNLGVGGTTTIDTNPYFANTLLDFSGTLTDFFKPAGNFGTDAERTVSGYEFVVGKYNGPNAGYILFAIGDGAASHIIPQFPISFWTDTDQYALSHWTAFNATSAPVPEPSVIALLAVALIGLDILHRRRQKYQQEIS